MATIQVRGTAKANKDGSFPVSLWERDDAHPGGEVFIADDAVHEVGETSAVNGALRDERLVRVSADDGKQGKR